MHKGYSYGKAILMYRLSTVYVPYIYRVSTVYLPYIYRR